MPARKAAAENRTASVARTAGAARAGGAGPDDVAIPQQLLLHLRGGRLVLFAGAGLSVQAGLPTWRSLIEDVVERTVAEAIEGEQAKVELASMVAAGKWLQIADHCKEKLGPGGYSRLLAERLSDSGRAVPEVHRLAVRLPFAAWITTNYDKLLERAYAEERGGLPKTLTNLDTAALGQLLFDGAPFVLKAHGDLDRPESLVFTSRDYRDHIHANTAFSAAFSAVLLTHSVLFVGYSLADPDFNLLLDRQLLTFQGFVPERYALMSGIGKVEEEYLWRVCRIRVIPYPEGRHQCVPRFFEQLIGQLALQTGAEVALQVAASLGPLLDPGAGTQGQRALAGAPAAPGRESVATVGTRSAARSAPGHRPPSAGPTVSGVATPTQGVAAAVPVGAGPPPLVLTVGWNNGSVQATLSDGATALASTAAAAERWSTLAAASRRLESRGGREGTIATYGAALGDMLGETMLARLAEVLDASGPRSVRLELARQVERLLWELLPLGTRTLGECTPVFRAPVGVSEHVRGLPAVGYPVRALVVGDTTATSSPLPDIQVAPLPGAAREAREVSEAVGGDEAGSSVRLLLGAEATYDAVAAAFEDLKPDVFHFAGHAWFDEHEPYLVLADAVLTASMMRPWLTRRSPAFMFLNSHFTAFIPTGVYASLGEGHGAAVQAGLGGRSGFSDLSMKSGVGAFVGSYSGSVDDNGARDFALSVYGSLMQGATVADAVYVSRRDRARSADADVTPLLFCAYGAGELRLVQGGSAQSAPVPAIEATTGPTMQATTGLAVETTSGQAPPAAPRRKRETRSTKDRS